MSMIKQKTTLIVFMGAIIAVLIACGDNDSSKGKMEHTANTGSIDFNIVFEPNPNTDSHQQGKAFSSCHDINTVTAQVFDESDAELSEIHGWDCNARHGTIKGVPSGPERKIVIRGLWVDDDGNQTLFDKGTAEGLIVRAGETTHVDSLFVEFQKPDDAVQLEILLKSADQNDDNYTKNDGDYDDTDPERYPNAIESCNGKDDNCDGKIDEGCPWTKLFGGENNDTGHCITPSNDEGYIIAGETLSFGEGLTDAWLIKIDESGNRVWAKTFGGPGSDSASAIIPAIDGGYIFVGSTTTEAVGRHDAWVMKIDEEGTAVEGWNKKFGGLGDDYAKSIIQSADGGYIFTGYTNSDSFGNNDMWIVKIDVDGEQIGDWDIKFDGSNDDRANAVIQAEDGGYILAGYTLSENTEDDKQSTIILKTHPNGEEHWRIVGQFSPYPFNTAKSLIHDADGKYIVAGSSHSLQGNNYIWLTKFDINGNEYWSKTVFSSIVDSADRAYLNSLTLANDGYYAIAGFFTSYAEGDNAFLIKTDERIMESDGWEKSIGGIGSYANCVIQANDGGFIIVGQTNSDLWIVKTDKNGTTSNME